MLILFILVWAGTRNIYLIPKSLGQNLWEIFLEFFSELTESISGHTKARQFFPLIFTLFIFILTLNWLGLLPGVGTIGLNHLDESGYLEFTPVFRAGTADLNTTLALAIVAMIAVQYYAVKYIGFKGHLGKFINFSNPINFFVGILELISEFAKVISFAFRLFGNIFAGEVLLAVMAFLIPVLIPVPFLGLEIFVGLIQAFVFAMLTLVFLTLATEKQGH
jgi:F-type H+-transporting ATPase subunit a